MAFSRYDERRRFNNQKELYRKALDDRGVNYIRQYSVPDMDYPTTAEVSTMDIQTVTWSIGERYWKIAERFYGNAEYWWVIAWFNKKPTEAHLETGDIVLVPRPLERILSLLGV